MGARTKLLKRLPAENTGSGKVGSGPSPGFCTPRLLQITNAQKTSTNTVGFSAHKVSRSELSFRQKALGGGLKDPSRQSGEMYCRTQKNSPQGWQDFSASQGKFTPDTLQIEDEKKNLNGSSSGIPANASTFACCLQVYNPYLEHMPRRTPKISNFKFYDIDGMGPNTPAR